MWCNCARPGVWILIAHRPPGNHQLLLLLADEILIIWVYVYICIVPIIVISKNCQIRTPARTLASPIAHLSPGAQPGCSWLGCQAGWLRKQAAEKNFARNRQESVKARHDSRAKSLRRNWAKPHYPNILLNLGCCGLGNIFISHFVEPSWMLSWFTFT